MLFIVRISFPVRVKRGHMAPRGVFKSVDARVLSDVIAIEIERIASEPVF
jgi:hypothetical protein